MWKLSATRQEKMASREWWGRLSAEQRTEAQSILAALHLSFDEDSLIILKRIVDAGQKFVICNAIRKMVTDTRDSIAGTQTSNEELRGDPRSIPEDAQFPEGWHRAGLDPRWP